MERTESLSEDKSWESASVKEMEVCAETKLEKAAAADRETWTSG